jgi:hypothetical protein
VITGDQLLCFTSPARPTLRSLHLDNVEGLSNNDLLNLLLHVSSTLAILSIDRCVLPRTAEDEEYAIDAAMSKMCCLSAATIRGPNLASVLAIARKPRDNMYSQEGLVLGDNAGLDVSEILAALETTGWHEITMMGITSASGWDAELAEKAHKVAADRGLGLFTS